MKISMYVAASMDGFIARTDGSIDWLEEIGEPPNDYGYQAFYDSVDAIVMGGRTYRQMAAAPDWFYAGKPVWVYSRGDFTSEIPDVFHAVSQPSGLIERLRSEGKKHLWVLGGGEIHSLFLRGGLIDEIRLFIMPSALGGGVPLFAPPVPDRRWMLADVKRWPHDVAELHYVRG